MEGGSREGCVTLRIARVRRTPAGTFEIDRSFIPPLLNLAASDYLLSLLRRLVEILASKSNTSLQKDGPTLGGCAHILPSSHISGPSAAPTLACTGNMTMI